MVAMGPKVPFAVVIGGALKGNSAGSVAGERIILGAPFVLVGEGMWISSVSYPLGPSCRGDSARRGSSLPLTSPGEVDRGLRAIVDSDDTGMMPQGWFDESEERVEGALAVAVGSGSPCFAVDWACEAEGWTFNFLRMLHCHGL